MQQVAEKITADSTLIFTTEHAPFGIKFANCRTASGDPYFELQGIVIKEDIDNKSTEEYANPNRYKHSHKVKALRIDMNNNEEIAEWGEALEDVSQNLAVLAEQFGFFYGMSCAFFSRYLGESYLKDMAKIFYDAGFRNIDWKKFNEQIKKGYEKAYEQSDTAVGRIKRRAPWIFAAATTGAAAYSVASQAQKTATSGVQYVQNFPGAAQLVNAGQAALSGVTAHAGTLIVGAAVASGPVGIGILAGAGAAAATASLVALCCSLGELDFPENTFVAKRSVSQL